MAELKLKFTADGSDAVKAAQATRQQIVDQFKGASQEVSQQKVELDFDTVFRQLTQFRIGLTQIARGDLGGVPNLIAGIRLAGEQSVAVKPKIASLTETIGLLDRSLKVAGAETSGKKLFGNFEAQLIKAADTSNIEGQKIRKAFQAVGIDIEQALLNPTKAFRQFLNALQGDTGVGIASLRRITGVSGDITKLVDGLGAGGKAVLDFEKDATTAANATKTLSAGLSTTTLVAGGTAIALAAAAAAMVAMEIAAVKLAFDFAAQAKTLQDVQNETGLTITTLQEYGAAGQITGLKLDDLANAQEKLIDRLAGTDKASEDFRKKLLAIGVSAENLNKPSQALEQLLPKLAQASTDTNVAAVAVDLFGKNSKKAADTAKELEANGGALKQTLRDLGVVTGGEAVAGAVKLDRQLKILDLSATGLKNKIAVELVPTVTQGMALVVVAVDKLGPAFSVAGKVANAVLIGVVALATVAQEKIGGTYEALAGIATLDGARVLRGFLRQASSSFDVEVAKIIESQKKLTASYETEALSAEAAARKAAEERMKRQREVDALNKKTKQPIDRDARNQLQALDAQLREEDQKYRDANARLQRAFQERLETEATFTAKQAVLANNRRVESLKILLQEEEVIAGSQLKPEEKTRELQQIAQKRKEIERETNADLERIQFDSRQRIKQAEDQLNQEVLQTLRASNEQKIALIENQIEAEIITNEEGQQRINEIILAGIQRRLDAQRIAEANATGSDGKIEAEKLKQLEIEKAQAEEEAARRTRLARQRDIQSRRQYLRDLQSIQNDIAEAQVGQLEDNADRNVNASVLAIQARAELERQLILQQSQEREQALQDQLTRNQIERDDDYFTQLFKLDNAEKITALLTAEGERRRELLKRISDREVKDLQAQNKTLKDVQKNSKDAIANGLAGSIAAYASGASGIRQAAASFYDAALQPLTDYLNKKAVAYFQESVARFAIGDYLGGAKYGIAGAAMAAAAGFVGSGGFVSGAIAGTGGLGGGTSTVGQLTGTRQDENTVSTDNRFRYYEAGRMVTEIRIVADTEQRLKSFQTDLVRDYSQGGVTRKVIRANTHGEPIY